jgi:methylaspartate mutase epsilon subunit
VDALEVAAAVAAVERGAPAACGADDTGIYAEADALIEAVLNLKPDIDRGLADAFRSGYLDVPYCPHPDNARRTRSFIDASGRLQWSAIGSMPIRQVTRPVRSGALTSDGLIASLSYVERKYDDVRPDGYLDRGLVAIPAVRSS